jgi:hypothetical protein
MEPLKFEDVPEQALLLLELSPKAADPELSFSASGTNPAGFALACSG